MAQYSLFEELGLTDFLEEETKKEEAKKEEAKKEEAKKSSSSKKPAAKKEEKLVFPLTVMTGICPPTILTKEQAGDADTLEKIADLVCKQTGVSRTITVAKKFADNKVAVVFDQGKVQAKGEFEITHATVAVVGAENVALAEIEGKRTIEEINAFIEKQLEEKVPYRFIVDGDRLYAIPGENVAVGMVSLPVTVKNPLGNTKDIVLTVDDFDDEEEGTEEVQIDDVREKVFGMADFKNIEPILELARPSLPSEKNTLFVTLKYVVKDVTGTTAAKKETYPTNAVISMLFNRIVLTPEMFGGREQVEAEEIIAILSKDYPEFTPDRTKLTYDKEGNYIFPALKSSAKGAVTYGSREECLAAAEEHPVYFLGNYMEDGAEVRYEKTPVSVTEASLDGTVGRFQWKLPKIPKQILEAVRDFFWHVSDRFETEALVQIGFCPDEGRYEVVIPEQSVDKISVKTEEMFVSTSKRFHVADIHSHNTMNAFFSMIDNEDEKANRVYGVMGSFDRMGEKEPKMLFRASTGGRFVSVSADEIFTDEEIDEEDVPCVEAMFENWLNTVTFK